jgi:hypothetical protein
MCGTPFYNFLPDPPETLLSANISPAMKGKKFTIPSIFSTPYGKRP